MRCLSDLSSYRVSKSLALEFVRYIYELWFICPYGKIARAKPLICSPDLFSCYVDSYPVTSLHYACNLKHFCAINRKVHGNNHDEVVGFMQTHNHGKSILHYFLGGGGGYSQLWAI